MSDIETTLGDIATWGSGGTPKRDRPEFFDGAIPWAVIGDLNDGLVTETASCISERGLASSSAKWIEPGSVLIAMYGSIGKLGIAGQRMTSNQAIAFARPDADVDAKYLFWYLRSIRSELQSLGRGGTQKNIGQGTLKSLPFPKPNIDKQRAVVEDIEKHMTRLADGVANLQCGQLRLARYRSAAVEACLPATDENLPPGWSWLTPKEIVRKEKYSLAIGPFGSNLKVSDYTDSGVPLVFVRHIRSGDFNLRTPYTSPEKADSLRAHQVHPGDVLVTKMGEPPGDACVYPLDRPPAVMTADCIKLAVDKDIADARYLAYVIPSRVVRRQVLSITRGVAQKKMSLGRFGTVKLPIPSVDEQIRIVEHLDEQMSVVEQAGKQIHRNLKMAERLRAAILRRAFSSVLQVAA